MWIGILFLALAVGGAVPAAGSGAPEIRIDPLTVSFDQQPRQALYVELDWMEEGTHSHRPSQAVVDRIVQTFAAAGFQLNLEVSNAIPHQNVVAINSSPSASAAVQSLMSQHFNRAGDSRYHYSIWGHNYSYNGSFTSSSGIGDLPGRVHLVTLGSFSGQTGTFSNKVGTFIHELGHNLGQRHGGGDHDNYKPNYLSVMGYLYQLSGIGPSLLALGFATTATGFDDFSYSHGLMPPLDESGLDESFGIGLGRAVDWNCNGTLETGLAQDVQVPNPCTPSAGSLSTLEDFDNWTSLAPQIRTYAPRAFEPAGSSVVCITPEEHQPLQQRIDRLREAGLIPPEGTGPPPAAAGDAGHSFLIYNDGSGPLAVSAMGLDVETSWIRWEPQAPFQVAPGRSQEVLVFVDFSQAPLGQTTRRLLVESDDADESPYPGGVDLVISAIPLAPSADFFTLPPCRVVDTRSGAPLSSQETRSFTLTGACGIPGSAKAVSVNVTVATPTGAGNVALWPADQSKPDSSVLNFQTGSNRANNALLTLPVDGSGAVTAQPLVLGGGTVHLVIDVNGYFE